MASSRTLRAVSGVALLVGSAAATSACASILGLDPDKYSDADDASSSAPSNDGSITTSPNDAGTRTTNDTGMSTSLDSGGTIVGDAKADAPSRNGIDFYVGGTLIGLSNGDTVVLQDNGGDTLSLTTNGPFDFPTLLATGTRYAVTVESSPSSPTPATCAVVSGGSGTIGTSDVASVAIECADGTCTGATCSFYPCPVGTVTCESSCCTPTVASLTSTSTAGSSSVPAANTSADDGTGPSARIGYVIGMRYAPATGTLWINDGRLRTMDANAKVVTRYTGMLPEYGNVGVDSAGNGYIYDGASIRQFLANGTVGSVTAVTLPATCPHVTSFDLGLDDRAYIVCSGEDNDAAASWSQILDVTASPPRTVITNANFSVVTDFVVDSSGHAFTIDPNNQLVKRHDFASGTTLDLIALTGETIAIDTTGMIYLANGKYAPNGTKIASYTGNSYGLAASTTKIFVPNCNYESTTPMGWACEIRTIAQ